MRIKRRVKLFLQDILGFMHRRTPGRNKPIFLFSTPRSGSTFVMNLFSTQRGIRCISEPLCINKDTPPIRKKHYIDLTKNEEKVIMKYFQRLITGDIFRISGKDLKYYGFKKVFQSDRVMFKLLHAPALIKWFMESIDGFYMYLIRHPIPTCLSRIRNNLPTPINSYLDSPTYKSQFLNPDLLKVIRHGTSSGSKLEKYVIGWCLENLFAIRKLRDCSKVLFLKYEDLVISPEREISTWQFMKLPDIQRMIDEVNIPSSSSHMSTQEHIEAITEGNREKLVHGWKERISEGQKKKVQRILNEFNMTLY